MGGGLWRTRAAARARTTRLPWRCTAGRHPGTPSRCPTGHRFPMVKYALLREGALAQGLVVAGSCMHEPERAPHGGHAGACTPAGLRGRRAAWHARSSAPAPASACRGARRSWSAPSASCAAPIEASANTRHHGWHRDEPRRRHASRLSLIAARDSACSTTSRSRSVGCSRRGASAAPASSTSTCTRGTAPTRCSPDDDSVYTFNMHGAKNFPFHKVNGSARRGARRRHR